jgi:hypothetical protein
VLTYVPNVQVVRSVAFSPRTDLDLTGLFVPVEWRDCVQEGTRNMPKKTVHDGAERRQIAADRSVAEP